jgi:zinc protease
VHLKAFALAGCAVAALSTPALARPAAVATAPKPAPVSALVRAIDIPYQQFTLPNGLRVVVHTDRKAPVVAVSVWYNVGAKFEPAGKTGFAHLFEHLMFNGSENAPGDFFEPLKSVGATDFNGTTNADRTNYFETVPTAALDRALFLESDRMGHLLGAIDQATLDEQRGVVQNEKRQGDNQPYGLIQYKLTEGLLPPTHPYGHTTIGSMADLDAASLETVKDWFRDHYGPNNAVLVLAGDVDLATARTLVTKYFGAIPRGPESKVPAAPMVTLPQPKVEVMKDRVAATMLTRTWLVPGLNDADSVALDVAASALGGLNSSRLDTILVRQEKLAVSVSASNRSQSQLGYFTVRAIVKPGVDPAVVEKRLDAIMADFLATGPTADEVNRVATRTVAETIDGLESVGGFSGKAVTLAEGTLYSNDPGYYKVQLQRLAAQTPATVKAAMAKWLTRPVYRLSVVPGPRDAYQEAAAPKPAAAAAPAPATPAVKGTRGALPAVGQVKDVTFPAVERTRLSNGIELVYAQRTAVPLTKAVLSFDAGIAADVPNKLGTQTMVLSLMEEGTTTRDATALAQAEERLGVQIGAGASADRTTLTLEVPSANLAGGVDLLADVARNPAFAPAEVARIKGQALAGIQQELTNPGALAQRVLPRLVMGPNYPYAKQFGGGDPAAVAGLTPDDLRAFHAAWLRPDKAKVFVVSDRPLAEVRAAFERALGDWRPSAAAAGVKDFSAKVAPAAPRIVLVDRPDSPQSVIAGGLATGLVGTDELLPEIVVNDALGGSFLSRINMDLRETKHWSYGANGGFRRAAFATPYVVNAPVQANQTGPSLASLRQDLKDFVGDKPMTDKEFDLAINGAIRSMAGNFETSDGVLQAMQQNDLYKRPDDYYSTITQRYRALTLPQLNAAARRTIDPDRFVWVVVGDAKVVRPQLDSLGLPVEVVPAASVAGVGANAN